MLAKLIIFVVDLTLVFAIFVILYAVYLIAIIGIFISVLLYIFKRRWKKTLTSAKAVSGYWILTMLLGSHLQATSSAPGCFSPFPAAREGASCPKKVVLSSKQSRALCGGGHAWEDLPEHCTHPTERYFLKRHPAPQII